MIDFSFYTATTQPPPDKIGEAVSAFRYKDFTEDALFKMLSRPFKSKGLNLIKVTLPKRPKKVGGTSLHGTTFTFDNGINLVLGITFDGHGKTIKPNDSGTVIEAKIGETKIPLAMRQGESMSFKQMMKFIMGKMQSLLPKELEKQRKKRERMASKTQDQASSSAVSSSVVKTLNVQKQDAEQQISMLKLSHEEMERQIETYQQDFLSHQSEIDKLNAENASLDLKIKEKEKELEELQTA